MAFNAYKDETRKNWGCEGRKPNTDELKLGALLRIADATEVMAREYQKLIHDRGLYKLWYENENDARHRIDRSNKSLRDQITKLRKRLSEESSNGRC